MRQVVLRQHHDCDSPAADRLSVQGGVLMPALSRHRCSRSRSLTVAYCRISCYSWGMTKTIAQRELRNENAKVIEAVTAGETFVVTRNGEPVAELRPLRAGRRAFISREEVAALAAAGVGIDRHQFRADLDQVIDQGL